MARMTSRAEEGSYLDYSTQFLMLDRVSSFPVRVRRLTTRLIHPTITCVRRVLIGGCFLDRFLLIENGHYVSPI
jgi:hypothetical protein